jgi:hypothetical protein
MFKKIIWSLLLIALAISTTNAVSAISNDGISTTLVDNDQQNLDNAALLNTGDSKPVPCDYGSFTIWSRTDKHCKVWITDTSGHTIVESHFDRKGQSFGVVVDNFYYYVHLNEDGKWGRDRVFGPFSDGAPFVDKYVVDDGNDGITLNW